MKKDSTFRTTPEMLWNISALVKNDLLITLGKDFHVLNSILLVCSFVKCENINTFIQKKKKVNCEMWSLKSTWNQTIHLNFQTLNQISRPFFRYLPEVRLGSVSYYRSKMVCERHFTLTLSGFLCTKTCVSVFVLSHRPPPCFRSFLAIPLPNTVTICAKNQAGRVCDSLLDSKAASKSLSV